jgi:hypothetical protein
LGLFHDFLADEGDSSDYDSGDEEDLTDDSDTDNEEKPTSWVESSLSLLNDVKHGEHLVRMVNENSSRPSSSPIVKTIQMNIEVFLNEKSTQPSQTAIEADDKLYEEESEKDPDTLKDQISNLHEQLENEDDVDEIDRLQTEINKVQNQFEEAQSFEETEIMAGLLKDCWETNSAELPYSLSKYLNADEVDRFSEFLTWIFLHDDELRATFFTDVQIRELNASRATFSATGIDSHLDCDLLAIDYEDN